MKISEKLAARVIVSCAREYHNNLENRNLLIIFGSPSKPDFFETIFLPSNFLHLTGVRPVSDKIPSSNVFYQKAMNGILNSNDFTMAANGTTERKLSVLPWLTKVHFIAKMVGDYNPVQSMHIPRSWLGIQQGFWVSFSEMDFIYRILRSKRISAISLSISLKKFWLYSENLLTLASIKNCTTSRRGWMSIPLSYPEI